MIEQLYADFTTKLLPKIQEGLVISKDYFMDLFGRYVKFLFITDLIYTILCLLIAITGIVFITKGIQKYKKTDDDGYIQMIIFLGAIPFILGMLFFIFNLQNVIKDKYIPEVRVFEELKSFNTK